MHRLRNVLERSRLVTAGPDATVLAVAQSMTQSRIGAIPVMAGTRLVGMFSERDLMTRVVVAGLDPARTRVSEVMTRRVVTASPEDPVHSCVEKMQKVGCRHLPVLEDGRLVSVISVRDLLRDELEVQDDEIRSLRAYLHQTPS